MTLNPFRRSYDRGFRDGYRLARTAFMAGLPTAVALAATHGVTMQEASERIAKALRPIRSLQIPPSGKAK